MYRTKKAFRVITNNILTAFSCLFNCLLFKIIGFLGFIFVFSYLLRRNIECPRPHVHSSPFVNEGKNNHKSYMYTKEWTNKEWYYDMEPYMQLKTYTKVCGKTSGKFKVRVML